MTEPEAPKHVKEYHTRQDKLKVLLDTTEVMHSEAYLAGLDAIRNDKGRVDYKMLKDVKNQNKMLDKMIDTYLSSAVGKLMDVGGTDITPPSGDFEKDIFLHRYVGITKSQLKRVLGKHKDKYTLKQHEGTRDELIKKQTKEMEPLTFGHLDASHIESILNYTKADKYIEKDHVGDVADLRGVMDIKKSKGRVDIEDLVQIGFDAAQFTAEGKKKAKAFKDRI